MNVLDLFSGIGGFSLGLERAGMRTVAFCEVNDHCRSELRRNWPGVPIHADIRNLTRGHLKWVHSVSDIDVICGGFPCQDISTAGKRAGIDGARSGLWSQYARIIGEVRPRFVIVENVAALLNFGLGRVLGDLAALGYDAQWHCISGAAIGTPHLRERVWIVAYPAGGRCEGKLRQALAQALDDISSEALGPWHGAGHPFEDWRKLLDQPELRRMDDGVSSMLDIRPRLHAYGNSVFPQIAEAHGRAIMKAQGSN